VPLEFQVSSLAVVREELLNKLSDVEANITQWSQDSVDRSAFDSAVTGLEQLSGTAQILNLKGLSYFFSVASQVLLSERFQSLPVEARQDFAVMLLKAERYIEFLVDGGLSAAEVLHKDTVAIARMGRVKVQPIAYYAPDLIQAIELGSYNCEVDDLKRLRTMLQTGLIALIRNDGARAAMMLKHAVTRLEKQSADADQMLWDIARNVIEVVNSADALPQVAIKQLTFLDKYLASVVQQRGSLDRFNDALVALCWVSSVFRAQGEELNTCHYEGVSAFDWNQLIQAENTLDGLSNDTLRSVAALVMEELRQARELLEQIFSDNSGDMTKVDPLITQLKTLAKTLMLIDQGTVSVLLDKQVTELLDASVDGAVDDKLLGSTADCLIYVDSCMEQITKGQVGIEAFDAAARAVSMNESMLIDAKRVALGEAKSKVADIKIAMNQFVESGYDADVLSSSIDDLKLVGGVLFSLNLMEPLAVVNSAEAFVSQKLLSKDVDGGLEPMLDTFADALVGLEYYVDQLQYDEEADASILAMARDSLSAVGF